MPQVTDLESFLENSAKAIRQTSVPRFFAAINEVMKTSIANSDSIDRVLLLVADEYDITVTTLKQSNARGKVQMARVTSFAILNYHLSIPQRHIAARIFNKWPGSVVHGLRWFNKLDPKIEEHRDFLSIYERLIKKLKNENI